MKGRKYEADLIYIGGDCRAFGVRYNARYPRLPGRNDDPGRDAVPAAAAAAATAPHDGDLPGRNGGQCWHSVPDAAATAASAATSAGEVGRTRLI